jgi:hypothetical protein
MQTHLRGEPWDEDGVIPVHVRVSKTDGDASADVMSDAQRKTLKLLRDYAPDVYPLVIEALEERFGLPEEERESYEDETYDAYEDQLYGGYDEQPGDGAPISDLFDSYDDDPGAYDTDTEPFDEQFSIQEIFIFDTDGDAAEWGLTGRAEFEPEHGIAVIFDYNEVIKTGYQDIVLSRLR